METNQYFIIWNHGIQYIEQIMTIIRDHPSLLITKIIKKSVNLPHFINHIYKLDNASKDHISAKTQYLNNMPPTCFIIIVKDLNTQYVIKPGTNHKYSLHETLIKWHIRLLFNPRSKQHNIKITNELLQNVSIQRAWFDGITHNHVIHSSDIEEETFLIRDYFKLNNTIFDTIGNIYKNTPKTIVNINISDIVANTVNSDHINPVTTPHYKYLLGEKQQYNNYIIKYLGTVITYDNLSGAYDKLINNFNYGKIIDNEPSYIICTYNKQLNKYIVSDGLHRLCILIFNKQTNIPIYVI